MRASKNGKLMLSCTFVVLISFFLPMTALAGLPADIYQGDELNLLNTHKPLWKDTRGTLLGLDIQAEMGAAGCGETDGTAVTPSTDEDPATDSETYTLTISTRGSGRTTPSAGTHDYAVGASATVTATPAAGFTFTGWSGAAQGSMNPVSVAMTSDKTLTANFLADNSDSGDNTGGDNSDLPEQCTGMCNSATPVYPTVNDNGGRGNVTMYTTEASDGGACNYGTTQVMYFAAMSVNVVPGDAMGQWQGGAICGQCVEVTAMTSQGPKKVVIRIMDKCPDGNCGIDLGGAAPAEVMVDGFGRYNGQWRFVSCDGHPEVSDGPPTLDVLNGSNGWWSRVHVRNGAGAVDSIQWRTIDGSRSGVFPFAANPENSYEVPQNEVLQSGAAGFLITVNYTDGSTATVTLSPQQLGVSGASYPLD